MEITMIEQSQKDFLDKFFQDLMDNLEFWDTEGNLKHLKK